MKIENLAAFKRLYESRDLAIEEYKRLGNVEYGGTARVGCHLKIEVNNTFKPILQMMVLDTIRRIEGEIAEIGGEVEAFDPAQPKRED